MNIHNLSRLFATYIGIDLGTANCLIYVREQGIIMSEPSVVAIKVNTKEVLAVGKEAKSMMGKTPPNLAAVRPMKEGVIADPEVTEEMLRYFIQNALRNQPWYKRLLHPRVLIAVPSGITGVESRAVKDSAKQAGAGEIVLVEEPMAAAVGVGLPVAEPTGSMIVDIGGGTSEVAIISLSGIVQSKSVKVGGDAFDSAIVQYIRKNYNLNIGEGTTERLKINLGSAYPVHDDKSMDICGYDTTTHGPKTINIKGSEIRAALEEPVASICEAVHATIDNCPPDLIADLVERGIMLAGGGALLAGLDKKLTEETGLPVTVAEEAMNAVAKGAGVMLDEESIWLN